MTMNEQMRLYINQLVVAALGKDDQFVQMTLDAMDQNDLMELLNALVYLRNEAARRLSSYVELPE